MSVAPLWFLEFHLQRAAFPHQSQLGLAPQLSVEPENGALANACLFVPSAVATSARLSERKLSQHLLSDQRGNCEDYPRDCWWRAPLNAALWPGGATCEKPSQRAVAFACVIGRLNGQTEMSRGQRIASARSIPPSEPQPLVTVRSSEKRKVYHCRH